MDSFERIQRLRDSYESALDEAERIRDEYHREIVKLHRSGMSLREIAEGLGISHQRVHQIVSPHEEKPRSKARRTAAGGAVAALALLVGVGFAVIMPLSSSTPSTERATPIDQPPAGFCIVADSPSSSIFTTLTLTARCGAETLRSGSIVAIDPTSGKIVGIHGVTAPRTLRDALAWVHVCHQNTDGSFFVSVGGTSRCPSWGGQDSNPRHEG